jgi:hypothetical protein
VPIQSLNAEARRGSRFPVTFAVGATIWSENLRCHARANARPAALGYSGWMFLRRSGRSTTVTGPPMGVTGRCRLILGCPLTAAFCLDILGV